VRTFIAIELDDAIRERLGQAQERLRACRCKVKWVEPQNIHLTLKFLGEIEEGVVEAVSDVMASAAAAVKPFELTVAGVGAFPPRGAPRVVWVGIERAGGLVQLHGGLEDGLERLGFEREKRRFSPHVTLGRVKDRRGGPSLRPLLEAEAPADFGVQAVEEVVLFRSVLSSSGPTYTALRRHRL